MHSQLIIGLEGPTLSSRERRWLAAKPPLGVILFSRNIEGEAQVEAQVEEGIDRPAVGMGHLARHREDDRSVRGPGANRHRRHGRTAGRPAQTDAQGGARAAGGRPR